MAGRLASRIGKVSPPRRARRFLRDDSGVTVVEFGLFSDCTGPGGLHVEVQVIDTFSDVDMTPPVNWTCDEEEDEAACAAWTRPEAYTPGQGSSIVTVQVYYQWPLILSMDWLGLSNLPSGKRLMAAATAFRNEPFT